MLLAARCALLLTCCTAAATAQIAVPDQQIPYGTPVALSVADYPHLADRTHVSLPDFALPDGRLVTLDLAAIRILAPEARLVEVGPAGETPLADPPVALFRGSVRDEPGARVFLAVSDFAVNGFIQTNAAQYLISSGPPQQNHPTLIFDPTTLPPEMRAADPFVCEADRFRLPQQGSAPPAGDLRGLPCRAADLAIDTDFEFRFMLGGAEEALSYAVTLIAAVSEIYKADTNMTFQIVFLRIWDRFDPWDQNNLGDQLTQLQAYWNQNETGINRHAVHLLSGRGLGGGVAILPGACLTGVDYGLSGNLNGSFPYPLQDNDIGNWDPFVVAHELGHNFGNPHTHDIGIDNCAGGDCSGAALGTIMSYCHGCPGGMANIQLHFHPTMLAQETLPFLGSHQCFLWATPPNITQQPANTGACAGSTGFTLTAQSLLDANPILQWNHDGAPIPGADGLSYTVDVAEVSDAGTYELVITNDCGSVTSTPAVVTICVGNAADVNGDCLVDLSDLAEVLAHFGQTGASPSEGDINGDGIVDLSDLAQILADFGAGC